MYGLYHFNASDEIAPIDNRTIQLLKYMRKEAAEIIAGAETKWNIYDLDDKTRQLWVQFINHKVFVKYKKMRPNKITVNKEGKNHHPMYKDKDDVFDAFCWHYDDTETLPSNSKILAFNNKVL